MTNSHAFREGSRDLPTVIARHGQAPVPWTTQLLVGLDVAVQRKSPWVSMTACLSMLGAFMLIVVAVMMIAGVSRQVIYAALAMFVALHWLLGGRLINAFAHRRRGRPARPDEVVALRRRARPGTWPMIQTAAADWRQSCPQLPITIAMILDWEDKAFRETNAAMPPTVAEQAAVRAQALAFE